MLGKYHAHTFSSSTVVFSGCDYRTKYAYDFLGQNVQTIWPDGSFAVNTYDGTRLIKQTSRTGNTTSFGFDLDGRTTSMTNSLGAVTLYYLDAFGNRTNVTDALTNQTLYIYDSMNRLTVTTRPDGSATTNTWDQLGRLVAKTGAGSVPVSYAFSSTHGTFPPSTTSYCKSYCLEKCGWGFDKHPGTRLTSGGMSHVV
jgi:YD repeat-containing protein